jgi:ethanolamine transporter EutH
MPDTQLRGIIENLQMYMNSYAHLVEVGCAWVVAFQLGSHFATTEFGCSQMILPLGKVLVGKLALPPLRLWLPFWFTTPPSSSSVISLVFMTGC